MSWVPQCTIIRAGRVISVVSHSLFLHCALHSSLGMLVVHFPLLNMLASIILQVAQSDRSMFLPCSQMCGDAADLVGALGGAAAAAHRHEQPRRDLVDVGATSLRGLRVFRDIHFLMKDGR